MWPWRRKRAETSVPALSPAPVPAAAPRPPAHQWRLVAPIQRVAGGDILTNPVDRFRGSLTTAQDPRLFGMLGHGLGPGEPSGTIGDLAQPSAVTPDIPAGSLPQMPVAVAPEPKGVQSFPAMTVSRLVEPVDPTDDARVTEPAEEDPDAGRAAAVKAPAMPVPASAGTQSPPAETSGPSQPTAVEPLPGTDAVEAAPTLGAPAPPITEEATDEAPVQRLSEPDPPMPMVRRVADGVVLPPAAQPRVKLGLGAPIQRSPQSGAPTVAAPTSAPSAGDAPIQRMPAEAAPSVPVSGSVILPTDPGTRTGQGDTAVPTSVAAGPVRPAADSGPVLPTLGDGAPSRPAEDDVAGTEQDSITALPMPAQRTAANAATPAPATQSVRITPTAAQQAPIQRSVAGAPPSRQAGADPTPIQRPQPAAPPDPVGSGAAMLPLPVQRVAGGFRPVSTDSAPTLGGPNQLAGTVQQGSSEGPDLSAAPSTPLGVAPDVIPALASRSPRLGLGAPIEPVVPVVERLTDVPSGPTASGGPTARSWLSGPTAPGGLSGPSGLSGLSGLSGPGGLSGLSEPSGPGGSSGRAQPSGPAEPAVPRPAGGPNEPVAQRLAGEPLAAPPLPVAVEPGVGVTAARADVDAVRPVAAGPEFEGPGPAGTPHDAGLPPMPGPTPSGPVQRTPAMVDAEPVTVTRPQAPGPQAAPLPLVPLHRPAVAATIPVVSRLIGDRPLRPALGTPAPPAAPAQTPAGQDGTAQPDVSELPAVPVAQLVADGARRAAPPVPTRPPASGAPPVLQLLTAAAPGPAPEPAAQRFDPPPITISRQVVSASADDPVPTVSRAGESAPAPSAGTPSATGVAAAGSAPGLEPDELVKKLFDPLLRRLKAELRRDRERRGSLTDLRH